MQPLAMASTNGIPGKNGWRIARVPRAALAVARAIAVRGKRLLRESLRRLGVDLALYRWRESSLASGMARRDAEKLGAPGPDGLPVPPASLIVLVGGDTSVDAFLHGGGVVRGVIEASLHRAGRPVEGLRAILELGCGCGRVVRHWRSFPGVAIHGCDYNERLVAWCRENLPFARFETNRLAPPLPYADGAFDLVYAISVFTHLDAALGEAWMKELGRVLEPGGHLLLTTHGRSFRTHLLAANLRAFDEGRLVVGHDEALGTNLCNAYHPESYVRETLARGWQVVEHDPSSPLVQDVWLLRKPS